MIQTGLIDVTGMGDAEVRAILWLIRRAKALVEKEED